MPRRKTVNLQRDIGVDTRFRSPLVQKLINMILERGRKARARAIVYGALGEGQFFDGLDVDCAAGDDLGLPLGDPAEQSLATALRRQPLPVVARVRDGDLWFDLRTIANDELPALVTAIETAFAIAERVYSF